MEELKLKKNIWAGQKQYKDSKLKAKYEYKTFKMDIEKSDLESHKQVKAWISPYMSNEAGLLVDIRHIVFECIVAIVSVGDFLTVWACT